MPSARRLLFVSTNPAPWGGSEEMWYELALRSLKEGHRVMVSIFRHSTVHPKIRQLMDAGAGIHWRALPAYYEQQPFAAWMLAHLKLRLQWDRLPLPGGPPWPSILIMCLSQAVKHWMDACLQRRT